MRINNKYYLHTLESMFAKDFGSPICPVLADFYFKLSKFEKAKQVCEIGLQHNTANCMIHYILAKVYLIQDDYIQAEKLLQHIVVQDATNFEALKLFIYIKILLKRSIKTYSQYIVKAYSINSKDKKINKLYNQLKIEQSPKFKDKQSQKTLNADIVLNQSLATKTMFSVFMKQKKYIEALTVLKMMKKNKENRKFIKEETIKVKNLINQ